MNFMKVNMNKKEFEFWKKDWLKRIPKCQDFVCCHETSNCAIRPLCGCGSIYETYKSQKDPEECNTIDCMDCMLRWECNRPRKLAIDSMNHNDRLMKKLARI